MSSSNAITTATKAKQNWIQWFSTRPSATTINQSHQEKLFQTFDASVANDESLKRVVKHVETCFLHKVNFGAGRISIFHHLVEVGGTIYDSSNPELGFLQGIGHKNAIMMTPDRAALETVTKNTATPVPTIANVLGVKSKADITELTASATVTYQPRNFVPIPPFLLESVNEVILTTNGNVNEVLLKCVSEIKNFDTEHNDDQAYTEKAKTKCKDFVYWLYLVGIDSEAITAVNTIGCNNSAVIELLEKVERDKIQDKVEPASESFLSNQVEASLKRPFEILAATSASTSEFMEKLTQLQSQSNEKTSKTFKKIPPKYQQMILVGASLGDVTEVEYNADAVEFFKCSTPLHAQVMLNSLFEAESLDCSVSAAVATTLLYGSFLWRNPISPSGLAASVLTTEGVLRQDTLQEGMVLDYATKFDMSSTSLSKLTKTQVLYPNDVEGLTDRIKGLQLLATFFFHRHGYMSQGLKKMVNFCLDYKTLLRTRIYLDESFITKVICAIDERVYHWLKQCSTHDMVCDTDLSLVNFETLIQDIKFNRFMYTLPPSIAQLVEKQEKGLKPVRRGENQAAASPIQNTKMQKDWKLRRDETWNNIFRNKTIEGPTLSMKCHPCLKFQVRGGCYSDCKNKGSHCVLVGEDKTKMDKFVKSLRGE